MTHWAILTGEYPPQLGGVADYTHLVARGLFQAGDKVTVFAPRCDSSCENENSGEQLIRLPDHFGPRGLLTLERHLARLRPDRILVQYVPHAFGCKGMNLLFALWLSMRARKIAPLSVMFHEVMYPIEKGQPLRHAVLGRVTRLMACLIARAADRVHVSIPAWKEILRSRCRVTMPVDWLPVPSNLPLADRLHVDRIRSNYSPDVILLGTFGTFGHATAPLLRQIIPRILRENQQIQMLCIGRESDRFRQDILQDIPELSDRLHATGTVASEEAAAAIAACDVLIQPYIDGASTRRTSLMAGLAQGVPVVTNRGVLSEAFWSVESDGVAVVDAPESDPFVAAVQYRLMLPREVRQERALEVATWYCKNFSAERTIMRLQEGTS